MNQKVKWNHHHEIQDHFQAQVQFQEKDNLPKCQEVDGGHVQVGMMKLKLDFQNDMILGSNRKVRDIRIGQRFTRKTFLALIDQIAHYRVQPTARPGNRILSLNHIFHTFAIGS